MRVPTHAAGGAACVTPLFSVSPGGRTAIASSQGRRVCVCLVVYAIFCCLRSRAAQAISCRVTQGCFFTNMRGTVKRKEERGGRNEGPPATSVLPHRAPDCRWRPRLLVALPLGVRAAYRRFLVRAQAPARQQLMPILLHFLFLPPPTVFVFSRGGPCAVRQCRCCVCPVSPRCVLASPPRHPPHPPTHTPPSPTHRLHPAQP